MITVACILIPVTHSISPLTAVGGLSLLKRAILTAQRAGARTCYILTQGDTDTTQLREELKDEERLVAEVVWTRLADIPTALQTEANEHCLCFSLHTLFQPSMAQNLDQTAQSGETWAVKAQNGTPALLLGPRDLSQYVLRLIIQIQETEGPGIETIPADKIKIYSALSHFVYKLSSQSSSSDSVQMGERALLHSLENPRDGFVDAYLNRTLSRPLTRLFLRTSLNPNQITLLSCFVGLLGAACFFQAGYWGLVLGALLLQLSAIVDCVDGEVARMKFLESPLGAWLDVTLDTVVHIATFLGLGFAVWTQGEIQSALFLGVLLAAGTVFSFPCVLIAQKTDTLGEQSTAWQNQLLEKMISGLVSRDYSIFILLAAIFQKLAWFLWVAAIGVHVFWITLLVLLFQTGRLKQAIRLLPASFFQRFNS